MPRVSLVDLPSGQGSSVPVAGDAGLIHRHKARGQGPEPARPHLRPGAHTPPPGDEATRPGARGVAAGQSNASPAGTDRPQLQPDERICPACSGHCEITFNTSSRNQYGCYDPQCDDVERCPLCLGDGVLPRSAA